MARLTDTSPLPDMRFSVAPMMERTDRFCRFFHRLLTKRALLFSEMVSSHALIHGDIDRHLLYHDSEHPVVLQLGGSDPEALREATKRALSYGYDEINLNVGCPSDRAQHGLFGAALMKTPDLVYRCLDAMRSAGSVPVTVKCRLGVDDQEAEETLPLFLDGLVKAGIRRVYLHARKAWLKGLSPKDNRTLPPLDYELAARMKLTFPELEIALNGGLDSLEVAQHWLTHFDGVMLGRAAYDNPALLLRVDHEIYGEPQGMTLGEALACYGDFADYHHTKGITTARLIRPLLGLFQGRPGARAFRRILTEGASRSLVPTELLELACREIADL